MKHTCIDTYVPRLCPHVPYSKIRIRQPRHDHAARRSVRDGTAARGRSVETDARAPRVRSIDRSDDDEDDDEDEDVRARDAIEVRDAMMTR